MTECNCCKRVASFSRPKNNYKKSWNILKDYRKRNVCFEIGKEKKERTRIKTNEKGKEKKKRRKEEKERIGPCFFYWARIFSALLDVPL